MDRLEKALMKAREQRRDALDQIGALGGRDSPAGLARDQQLGNVSKLPDPANTAGPPPAQTRQVALAENRLEQNRIVARLRKDSCADTFRILRTKVMQLMARNSLRSIAVTRHHRVDQHLMLVQIELRLRFPVRAHHGMEFIKGEERIEHGRNEAIRHMAHDDAMQIEIA